MSVLNLLRCSAVILTLCYQARSLAVEIPTSLARKELDEVVDILGHSTSSKFLSNPFSLGGYSGFEVGLSTEIVNTTDLSRLGDGTDKQTTFEYNRISFGKGLYYHTDIFLHFVPFSSSNEVSAYGGLLKWNFHQAQYLPISFSVLGHYNTINIQDTYINETLGWDLMGGININNLALYFGGGRQMARSTFAKSVLNLSDTNIQAEMSDADTLTLRKPHTHSFIGINIDIANLFIAAQIDRYEQPVYGLKLGLRF